MSLSVETGYLQCTLKHLAIPKQPLMWLSVVASSQTWQTFSHIICLETCLWYYCISIYYGAELNKNSVQPDSIKYRLHSDHHQM